jgi:hypothetical protein
LKEEEEKEEEASLCLDRGANKREHIYHPFVISSSIPIGEVRSSQH